VQEPHVEVRAERRAVEEGIRNANVRAFGSENEATLVGALRGSAGFVAASWN